MKDAAFSAGRSERRARWAAAAGGACAFLNLYATQPLLPLLADVFKASPAEAGLTITAGTLAIALVAPLAGGLADGWGRKRVILLAILAVIVPTLLAAQAGSLTELILWRFVQGLFLPFIFAITVAYVGEEWEAGEAAAVTGLYIAGTVLGGFSGRLVAGLVADAAGWRAAFLALAAIDALYALVIWRWLPAERKFVARPGLGPAVRAMASHLGNPSLRAAYAIGFLLLFVLVSTFTYSNFLLAAPPYTLPPSLLGSVFVVYLAGAAASPVAGRLAGRYGHRRVASVGVGIACLGLCLSLLPSLVAILAGLAVATIGIFTTQSVTTAFVTVSAPFARSAAVGLYVSAYYLGGSVGAVLPAPAWQAGGWPACVAVILGAEALILIVALGFWRRPMAG